MVPRMMASATSAAGTLAVAAWLSSGCARTSSESAGGAVTQTGIAGPAGKLHADDGGTGGIPVVFVHSFAGTSQHWSAQLAHLRTSRRAVALDLRGHGESAAPLTHAYAVDSLASDIAAVVDGLGLERFVLVGHSMGGSAAIAYAGAHPERLAGLVLVGTPGRSDPAQARKIMDSMKADYDTVTETYWRSLLTGARPEVDARIREEMKTVPRDASMAMIQAVFDYDPLPALQAYTGPRLIVDTPHGEQPLALHNLAPEVPRKLIAGTSHWPQMDKPEEFNQILDEFLGAVR